MLSWENMDRHIKSQFCPRMGSIPRNSASSLDRKISSQSLLPEILWTRFSQYFIFFEKYCSFPAFRLKFSLTNSFIKIFPGGKCQRNVVAAYKGHSMWIGSRVGRLGSQNSSLLSQESCYSWGKAELENASATHSAEGLPGQEAVMTFEVIFYLILELYNESEGMLF